MKRNKNGKGGFVRLTGQQLRKSLPRFHRQTVYRRILLRKQRRM